jgi:hypothetical protein
MWLQIRELFDRSAYCGDPALEQGRPLKSRRLDQGHGTQPPFQAAAAATAAPAAAEAAAGTAEFKKLGGSFFSKDEHRKTYSFNKGDFRRSMGQAAAELKAGLDPNARLEKAQQKQNK